MKIIEMFLKETKYGLNLFARTDNGKLYQQVHRTICYEGGGSAVWQEVNEDEITKPTTNDTTN